MSTSYPTKPRPTFTNLPELQSITSREFTPIYFASVELVEAAGYKQDAFDVVHDAFIMVCTTRRWKPAEGSFRDHFLTVVRDALLAERLRRDKERYHRDQEPEVARHYEEIVVPFVGSVASPEDVMIAREDREEHQQWRAEKRAQIRQLQRSVASDPVAIKLLEYWAEHGANKPLPKIAASINVPIDAVYKAKKLIERHAHRIIVEKKGDDQ